MPSLNLFSLDNKLSLQAGSGLSLSVALMLARPHICPRCQLCLAKQSATSRSLHFAKGAKFSSAPRSVANSTDPPDTQEQGDRREYKNENGNGKTETFPRNSETWRTPNYPPPRASKTSLSEYPLGKMYGFSGQMQRSGRENLEATVLGEPAEVIVLRDSKIQRFVRYMDATREIEEQKAESIDILATLDSQRGIVSPEEVNENIGQLRPKYGQEPETMEDFNALVLEVSSGFTVPQLAHYIESFPKENLVEPVTIAISTNKSPFQSISQWIPDISESTARLDQRSGRGYAFASYTGKQRLALQLMRNCWDLELPELEEGIGEQEIELHPDDYDILLSEFKRTSLIIK